MNISKIAVIGAGNMGGAIAHGLVASGFIEAKNITVTRRNADRLKSFAEAGMQTTTDNNLAVKNAQVVILAVKPYLVEDVIQQLRGSLPSSALVISVATGVSLAQLEKFLPAKQAVVRAMPNTAAEVGEAVTALCTLNTTDEQTEIAREIFSKMGLGIVIDEQLMPAITALSACGIAHALRFIRACQEAGIEMGLTAKDSAKIAAQTVQGAAALILKKETHPEIEIDKVCTPKGVTIKGINELEHNNFSSAVIKGILGSFNSIVK